MNLRTVHTWSSLIPADDDHPYRTGAWRPQVTEYDADDLDVVEGAIPAELDGVYLRNTENPLVPAIGRYHPFDGDGMLHAIRFAGGKARYRNRMIRTAGLAAELAAGEPLWAGIIEAPASSKRADGWGARGRMKDAASTDVVVHAGRALATFYQCGDPYQLDPETLAQDGPARWDGQPSWGVSAHTKVDETTGELLYFSYATEAPYLRYGVLDEDGHPSHRVDVPLPGPRLPHDMAFTERYAILNDFPLFWDPEQIARGVYRPKFHRDLPSRFAVIPRRGRADEVRWFEAEPTYVLHWINAFEDGDTIVLDGYHQEDPTPRPDPADGPWAGLKKMVDLASMKARPRRWRFDLRTGRTTEEPLLDLISEFPTIDGRRGGRRHRYVFAMTAPPGWFLFDGLTRLDMETGELQRWRWPDGVYASESPVAPRAGGTAEDDGWVVTFVSDVPHDRSECHVFDARRISDGPVARVRLPERISSGTHACWAPASALRGGARARR
ncbi:MAG: carotenoid oxygenase family protein [Myxococcales bacterium]|nr:carotenoid oxygenase family protein [Myxococcales bacterium]